MATNDNKVPDGDLDEHAAVLDSTATRLLIGPNAMRSLDVVLAHLARLTVIERMALAYVEDETNDQGDDTWAALRVALGLEDDA